MYISRTDISIASWHRKFNELRSFSTSRRSIRLKGFDYSSAGAYFITICCEDRLDRFGKVTDGEMILNDCGMIAYNEWHNLAERFLNFELDVFQIMPNHMHGIIVLSDEIVVGQPLRLPKKNVKQGQPQGLSRQYPI